MDIISDLALLEFHCRWQHLLEVAEIDHHTHPLGLVDNLAKRAPRHLQP